MNAPPRKTVVEIARDLIRIPSVNPMGGDDAGDQYYETALSEYLIQSFQQLGLAVHRQIVSPGRENIVARLDGATEPEHGGRILMFEAHQDTVPTEGMTIPPWTPDVRDGRVYGRGACDVKGPMAAMIAAVARQSGERPPDMPTIVMACTVDEEYGVTGANRLKEIWSGGGSFLPRPPDAIIVAEPTLLNAVVTHRGVIRWFCHTSGVAVHSSKPQLGESAIYRMGRVVTALEEYARDVVPTLHDHPLLGSPTLSVGVIAGGTSVNVVPDACRIEIDRRLHPGEQPGAAFDHVVEYLKAKLPSDIVVRHDEPYIAVPALSDRLNGELSTRLCESAQRHGATGECHGAAYGTNAPSYEASGIPTVVFGPGSVEQAHTIDEWIAVEQLESAAEIYCDFAQSSW